MLGFFTNSDMTVLDQVFVWANLVFAAQASYWGYQAGKRGAYWLRKVHFQTSALAAFFTLSYLSLIIFDFPPRTWADVMRGATIIVWPVVWTATSKASIRAWEHSHDSIGANMSNLRELRDEFTKDVSTLKEEKDSYDAK